MTTVHQHPEGVFCDDCPDALRRNIKRILVQHRWTNTYTDRDCVCGWRMPFTETDQHAAHVADVLSAELGNLGWSRATPAPVTDSAGEVPPVQGVECSWCQAGPGEPCTGPGTGYHLSRFDRLAEGADSAGGDEREPAYRMCDEPEHPIGCRCWR